MASSDTDNIFIRKDVFEARMDRMEMLLEKTLTEMRADNERFRAEIKADNEKLRTELKTDMNNLRTELKTDISSLSSKTQEEIQGLHTEIRVVDERVNSLTTRVDTLQTTVYWGFALLTLFLGLTTFAPALLEFIKSLRKPSITANEIQAMIDVSIAKAIKLK
ncbi:MAG: hypothetical protein IJQ29_05370 [Synergistaceae bacterium]|nr:hypothetical protein [Synergistaceae bacterium]MBQ6909526.1 hypothetical protein [Synergistaceae bacterium]